MEPKSLIYAELLPNIRQISLAISLSSPSSQTSTRVTITADGEEVQLQHHGDIETLKLPAKAALGGAVLPIQKPGATALSWRLPLQQTSPASPLASRQGEATDGRVSPWSATDLQTGSGVSCRRCGTVLVKNDAITVWKDLPSENWAEMMEFWHCHKPDNKDDHSHAHAARDHVASSTSPSNGHMEKADESSLAARGYGASSIISAQEGVGFVDLTALLFAESNCFAVTFSRSAYECGSTNREDLMSSNIPASQSLNIFCSSCHSQIGFFNFRTAAVTLLKWQISCKSASGAAPGISECLAATLVSTISRSGSSKSLLTPISGTVATSKGAAANTTDDTVVHIWVLNSNIVYSSSGSAAAPTAVAAEVKAAQAGTPAIKLLYRLIPHEEADRMLEIVTCDAQEINLPAEALGRIEKLLDGSNLLFPPAERTFKEWKVGVLTR
ncbi:ubiquitin-conjugating enzyme E2-binding protein [Apodospora peruviana]|uniref:Ubiquitin-conjugating enzyme E2-binding protein n=1 Tax=Apodospora peruviana TaxID=516989 RepID=A0AAE0IT65_9PEZI|nr:ubiquitin-conjugating enzyme E2-binding protein [Apodospora peruviana]